MVDLNQLVESPKLNRMNYKVSPKRHIAKSISYRLVSTGVGFLIMWYATGSIKFGAAFGFAELLLKPFIYYLHERAWYRWTKFGLIEEKKPSFQPKNLTESEFNALDGAQSETFSEEPTNLTEPKQKKVLSYSSNR
jgi:uncharacterized membrane protein